MVPPFMSKADCSFQEISGINASMTFDDIQEGGTNTYKLKLPTGVSWEPLVLKRGIIKGSWLINWVQLAINTFSFTSLPIIVTLLGDNGQPVLSWNFLNAYPIGMKTSNLNAMGTGEVLFETLEFHHQGCYRIEL